MQQPEGFIDEKYPNKVCRLKKTLYGLKQSARCWNEALDTYLKSNGYTQSDADGCIYYYTKMEGNKLLIIAVYVDDTVIASNDLQLLRIAKKKLKQKFKMDDRGEIHFLLGMRILRNRKDRILTIDQSAYLENIIQKYGMEDCRPIATPMEAGKSVTALSDEEEVVDIHTYQSVVGSLIYASICTRPDLTNTVRVLSQFMSKPGSQHWVAVKRVLRYLKATLNYGLIFVAADDFVLKGYSDADWAGDVGERKSTSGYVFRLGNASISWKSKKQTVVALSTTEAEYIALCAATQEAVWLRRLLKDIHMEQVGSTLILEDNTGAIALSKNAKGHERSKHIDIKFHYTREAVSKGIVHVSHCPTDSMLADVFTKGLAKPKFEGFRSSLGVDQVLT